MFEYLKNRDIILTLTKYEFKQRYRGTILGVAWSLIVPFLMALVLYVIFSKLLHRTEYGVLYLVVGIFFHRYFALGTSIGLNAITAKAHLVTKTTVPREILPLSTTLAYGLSSFMEMMILLPGIIYFGGDIRFFFLLIVLHPIYILLIYGSNLILSSLNVYFRDLKEIWGVVTQLMFFMLPIIYPIEIIPENLLDIYMLNPLVKLLTAYRDVMIYGKIPNIYDLGYVIVVTLVLLIAAHIIFKKLEKGFVERV
uniref:Transport permease protein n=1 Tax=Fervidobacterium pennivorans TaxID=93466 RepID=A0A7V4KEH6_FERPE